MSESSPQQQPPSSNRRRAVKVTSNDIPHLLFFDTLPLAIAACRVISRTELRVVFLNRAAGGTPQTRARLTGLTLQALLPLATALKVLHYCQLCLDTEAPVEVEDSYMLVTGLIWARSKYLPVREGQGPITHILLMWEDITAQKQHEQAAQTYQEERIRHQAAPQQLLSTPAPTTGASPAVLVLIGAVDTQRAQQLLTALLAGADEYQANVVVLDLSDVSTVDTQVSALFLHISQATELLGTRVVITGVRPAQLQALAGLGIDLRDIVIRNTLRDGIAYALRQERAGDGGGREQ